jgi:signal transduction histidine kinase
VSPATLALENARLRAALQQERDRRTRIEDALRCHDQRVEPSGRLVGDVAHDFNGILALILGYGEKAQRLAPRGSLLRDSMDGIMTAVERGRALVERNLALSRAAQGACTAVPVESVVRETLEMVAANVRPEVRIETRLAIGQAAMRGDPIQVHRVVMNLVTNALQAMTGGTLRVALVLEQLARPRAATTGTVAPGDYIVLTVADEGPGIPPAIIDRIFEPFFTTKEVGVGTGLGLSIVHRIVAAAGGAVHVESTPDAGTLFTVYLPRVDPASLRSAGRAP